MLIRFEKTMKVEDVPIGAFFYLKPQGGNVILAFMAHQKAIRPNDFEGPVVLLFPESGQFMMPRSALAYPTAVAATFPKLDVVVDSDNVEESSTEGFSLTGGQMLLAGEDYLLCFERTDREYGKFVNLGTGVVHLQQDPGTWLSFNPWELRVPEGETIYTFKSPE